MDKIDKINVVIRELFELYPLEYKEPIAITEEMRYALAKCYSDEGMRHFLENEVLKMMTTTLRAKTIEDLIYQKAKITVLMFILTNGRMMFNNTLTKFKKAGIPLDFDKKDTTAT